MTRPSPTIRPYRKWLLLGLSTFLLLEIGLHVIFAFVDEDPGFIRLSPYKDKAWAKDLYEEYLDAVDSYHPHIGWRGEPYSGQHVNVNENGLRKTWNPADTSHDVEKLYIFGGSTVWGTGARDDFTVPSHLSKIFHHNKRPVIVTNCGESAYTFYQEVMRLCLLLKEGHRPDYVVFYDGVNDVQATYATGEPGNTAYTNIFRHKTGLKSPLDYSLAGMRVALREYNVCRTYRLYKDLRMALAPQQSGQAATSSLDTKQVRRLTDKLLRHHKNTRQLVLELARAYDFKVHFFWQPVIYTETVLTDEEAQLPFNRDPVFADLYKSMNRLLLDDDDPTFTNIHDVLHGHDQTTFLDWAHLTEEGNESVARRIHEVLHHAFFKE